MTIPSINIDFPTLLGHPPEKLAKLLRDTGITPAETRDKETGRIVGIGSKEAGIWGSVGEDGLVCLLELGGDYTSANTSLGCYEGAFLDGLTMSQGPRALRDKLGDPTMNRGLARDGLERRRLDSWIDSPFSLR